MLVSYRMMTHVISVCTGHLFTYEWLETSTNIHYMIIHRNKLAGLKHNLNLDYTSWLVDSKGPVTQSIPANYNVKQTEKESKTKIQKKGGASKRHKVMKQGKVNCKS